MYAYIRSLEIGRLAKGHYLVMIRHKNDHTLSILDRTAKKFAALGYPGVPTYPLKTPFDVTDSDGDNHTVIVLKKA